MYKNVPVFWYVMLGKLIVVCRIVRGSCYFLCHGRWFFWYKEKRGAFIPGCRTLYIKRRKY